jgi:serine/threonine-protein kinase
MLQVGVAIDVGHIVAGKYELVRLLGRGSMGEVWVAHHRTLREYVALKLLTQTPGDPAVEDRATAAARFRFEAQIAARLSRKTRHIVRVTDHGEEDELAYLVMELLEGQTLDTLLMRRGGSLPPDIVTEIVGQIVRALNQAHAEGVLHRDLKPANVFVAQDEDGHMLLKLLDFGIARAIHSHRVTGRFATARGLIFGTPGYMSPEQAQGSSKLDHRCDLWALAALAYELLTGSLPVDGVDTDEVIKNLCTGRIIPLRVRVPDLPLALDALFARAFAESIDERFSSAAEFAREFRKAGGAGLSPETPPPIAVSSVPRASVETSRAAQASSQMSDSTYALRTRASPKPAARIPLGVLAFGGAFVAVVAAGAAWRVVAGSTAVPAATVSGVGSASARPAGTTPPIPPATSSPAAPASPEPETLAVSALPRVLAHPPSAVRGPAQRVPPLGAPHSLPAPAAASATTAAPPAVAPPPASVPPKPIDKSEVL